MIELDDIRKLRHMLGLDMASKPYRNHYCAYFGGDAYLAMTRLMANDLVYQSSPNMFHATEKGYEILGFIKQDDD